MTDYIFIALGAIVGLLGSFVSGEKTLTHRIESIAIGIFGSGIGGLMLYSAVNPARGSQIDLLRVLLGVGLAVAMLVVLRVFRGAVGPLRAGKRKPRAR